MYATRHAAHTDPPRFRADGRPVGSGVTGAGVKPFDGRVPFDPAPGEGTEQFWSPAGIEPTLALRPSWVGQGGRWDRYWDNSPAYVN